MNQIFMLRKIISNATQKRSKITPFFVIGVEEVGRDKIHYGYFFVRFWLCEVLCKLFLHPIGHPICNVALTHTHNQNMHK